jgi:cell division protein FtsQ
VSGPARRSPWGAVALVMVMVGVAAWLVANSAFFAAGEIRVLGNVRLTAVEVQRLAGISAGENVLRLGIEGAVRALERNPWVARASVDRLLPSTVVIRVEERRPVGWLRDGEGSVLVALDGTVLERSGARPREVPFVGRWETVLEPGRRVNAQAVLRTAGTLPPDLARRIQAVWVDRDELVLEVRGGGEARYGTATALGEKHAVLASVLRWASDRHLKVGTVDLRIPGAPSVRLSPSRS